MERGWLHRSFKKKDDPRTTAICFMPKTEKANKSKSQPDGEIQLHLWLPDGSSLMGSYQLYRVWGQPVVTTGPSFEPKKSQRPLSKKESEGLSALFG